MLTFISGCRDVRIASMSSNGITLLIATDTGPIELTLFGLPGEVTDKLIAGLGAPKRVAADYQTDALVPA